MSKEFLEKTVLSNSHVQEDEFLKQKVERAKNHAEGKGSTGRLLADVQPVKIIDNCYVTVETEASASKPRRVSGE
jgi:hypothetical protein